MTAARIATGLLLLAIVAALVLLPVGDWVRAMLIWAEANRAISWLVFALVYVVATVVAFPSWVLTVAGGYLFGFVGGVALVSAASLAGAIAAFGIGRTLARDWVRQRVSKSANFAAIDRAIERKALAIVFLTRLSMIVPYNVLNYTFGLTAVTLRQFALGTWAGMLPAVILYVLVGRGARDLDAIFSGEFDTGPLGPVSLVVGAVFALVVVVLITRLAARTLREELARPADELDDVS